MVVISDIFIAIPLEAIFIYLLYKSLEFTSKGSFVQVLNLTFLFVNLLVLITLIVSDMNMSIDTQGWILGFLTGLSYLILPWAYYWFMSNYKHITTTKSFIISRNQEAFLILALIVGLLPLIMPDLITITQTNDISAYNWDYGWQILGAEFMLWLLFLLFYVSEQSAGWSHVSKTEHRFVNNINISAILIFSTPVFFVINSSFIIISLVVYVIAYIFVFNGFRVLNIPE